MPWIFRALTYNKGPMSRIKPHIRWCIPAIGIAYMFSYIFLSARGLYVPYSNGSVVVSGISMPAKRIWLPDVLDAHALRRWLENPTASGFKEISRLTIMFAPLICLDWWLVHRDERLL